LNAKQLKIEKKKAQYEKRIRALEEKVYKLQDLTNHQHKYIQQLNMDYFEALAEIGKWKRGEMTMELSTTHTPYPQLDSQTQMSLQYPESIETIPASDLSFGSLDEHTDLDQEQNTLSLG
jgi:hypothetical protein